MLPCFSRFATLRHCVMNQLIKDIIVNKIIISWSRVLSLWNKTKDSKWWLPSFEINPPPFFFKWLFYWCINCQKMLKKDTTAQKDDSTYEVLNQPSITKIAIQQSAISESQNWQFFDSKRSIVWQNSIITKYYGPSLLILFSRCKKTCLGGTDPDRHHDFNSRFQWKLKLGCKNVIIISTYISISQNDSTTIFFFNHIVEHWLNNANQRRKQALLTVFVANLLKYLSVLPVSAFTSRI